MVIREFKVEVSRDELGKFEETTWDLFPLLEPELTKHLDEDGLPKTGTLLKPGMVLVGKIGKTEAYLVDRKPTDLEIHDLSFGDLREQFGHLWKDASVRMPNGVTGNVVASEILNTSDGKRFAVIQVDVVD